MPGTSGPHIALGAPVLVSQAPPGLTRWGPWQFPAIQRLPDGRLQLAYHIEDDSATAYGTAPGAAISDDDGQTWTEVNGAELARTWISGTLMLPNGDLLRQVILRSRKLEDIRDTLPAPFATVTGGYGEERTVYLAEEMPPELAGWRLSRLAKGSRKWTDEVADVRIPGAVREVTSGVLVFPWMHRMKLAPDGALWGISHSHRVLDGALQEQLGACFIRSTDNGHTWGILSEIPYQPDKQADKLWDKREGFTEPNIAFLPDGSVFCLLRTTDGHGVGPLYMSRSTDSGTTWSRPTVFDGLGVWPALVTLGNGVTLASYGRPGLYIRATGDRAGESWGPKVTVVRAGEAHSDTCSYSALIALGDHSALIAYSEFNYPDQQGRPRKSILVRRIDVQ